MAKRYGGAHSPKKKKTEPNLSLGNTWKGQVPSRVGGRANFLFVAPLPLAIRAFTQDPAGLIASLVGLGLLLLAAWMTREGLFAQEAYDARKVARRPAVPRKILASVFTGAGLFVVAFFPGGNLINGVIFGVLGAILHSFSFGLDPLQDKGMQGVDSFQQDRVARAVGEAEKHLTAMKDAILRAQDRGLEHRVDMFCATARDMFRTVEEDPRDLTAARRYLGVYLLGARDATAKFADLYARNRDANARHAYEALLDDLEQNFSERTRALLEDNETDMTVEIDVLRERLAREGVRSSNE